MRQEQIVFLFHSCLYTCSLFCVQMKQTSKNTTCKWLAHERRGLPKMFILSLGLQTKQPGRHRPRGRLVTSVVCVVCVAKTEIAADWDVRMCGDILKKNNNMKQKSFLDKKCNLKFLKILFTLFFVEISSPLGFKE